MALPVGGFMPIPLALMIPFMATQSLVMGESFGTAFQYGKRRISAMSNEDFNKLKLEDIASQMFKSYENIIPELKQSIKKSTQFQNFIFATLLDMPRGLLAELFGISPETPASGGLDTDNTPDKFQPPETSLPTGKEKPPVSKTGNLNFQNPLWIKARKVFDLFINKVRNYNTLDYNRIVKPSVRILNDNKGRKVMSAWRVRQFKLANIARDKFLKQFPANASNYSTFTG